MRALHVDEAVPSRRSIGRDVNCVLTFNDAAAAWARWETPWLTVHSDPNQNWSKWTAAVPGRQMIITMALMLLSENATNWRAAGARGDYDEHARALARNLVATNQANAVIRLGHEANGDWYADNIGTTQADFDLWVKTWRHIALAMKSVPGAHFTFDWCVNGGWRAIPLSSYYPGDDVVDIVGIDAYDSGIPNVTDGAQRWSTVLNRRSGVAEVLAFAKAHNKPMSIPEWGVAPTWEAQSGGDDGPYVDGIAQIVRDNNVAYQSYFYAYAWRSQLETGVRSLTAYRRHFGVNGDALGVAPATTTVAPATTTTATAAAPATATTQALPVTAPTAVGLAAPAALRRTSAATAAVLARAAAKQVRAARRPTAGVALTPPLSGTACATVLAARARPVRLRCGATVIRAGGGARAAIARASEAVPRGRWRSCRPLRRCAAFCACRSPGAPAHHG